jgi:hypothetical protein
MNETDESFRLSGKSYLIIFLASLFITFTSSSHGITEAWAWEIARNLITVNGLILGFIVFGATILSRRSFTRASYESMMEELVDKIITKATEYVKSGKTVEECIEKEYPELWKESFYSFGFQMGSWVGKLSFSVTMILVSIGFAFCLFGVNDANIKTLQATLFFLLVYFVAMYFFIVGVYYSFNLIVSLLGKSIMLHEEPSKTLARIVEERIKRQSIGQK